MKHFLILAITTLFVTSSHAQFSGGGGRGGMGGGNMNIGRFYGKLIDSKTNKGVDAASVQLIQSKFDTVLRKRKDTIVGGMLTRANGEFSIENLSIGGNYRLKVTAIGYKTIDQKVAFEMKMGQGGDMSTALAGVDKDLGNIKMENDAQVLDNVTVTGSKPLLQMGIDRKIFNVDKNIVSAGGNAVDVMRNVPTVNVDVDGNITLRNNAPQIFVDGRPTTLTLEQIPADAIQSIELITNPSAKFDASGGQSAIINIVLKKNKRTGYSGGVRAGIDMRGRVNLGGDVNARQGKINLFANANYSQRKSIGFGTTDQLISFRNPDVKINQDNDNTNRGFFAFGRVGADYFIDNRNTITFSQTFVKGTFNGEDLNNFRYDTLSTPSVFETQYRNTLSENMFRNYGSQLSFKHNFAKPGKEWTADVNFNQSKSNNDADIRIRSFDMSGNPKFNEILQGIDGGGSNKFLIAQTDYSNPLTENKKIEMGLRAQIRRFESRQFNYFDGVLAPQLSNEFDFKDYVYAAYTSYSEKIKKANLNYQLGLRVESSQYDATQIGKGSFANEFPLSLFPSAFISKTFKNNQDMQLNYTRRINRPNFFQLIPNTDYSDPLNFQTGNPDLKPEFTNSLEVSYQKQYGEKNNTFLATLFGKYTTDLISRYQRPNKVGGTSFVSNPVIPDSANITTYINASSSYAAGLELVFRNTLASWWEINYNVNIYYSKINGSASVPGLENERTSWFAKINNTFKLGKGWTVQLSGDYLSKSILPVSTSNGGGGGGFGGGGGRGGGGFGGGGFGGGQLSTTQGYVDENYYADLGLRKEFKIKTNTATISVNWSDMFRTRRNRVYSTAVGFDQYSLRRRDPQFVRVNFSYRFGKFDVNLFKRKNMRGDSEGMQNSMQGVQQ